MPATTTQFGGYEYRPEVMPGQVRDGFKAASFMTLAANPEIGFRSWTPCDALPLTDDPVAHAGLAFQPAGQDAIYVLGDDGRWRSVDVSGLELPTSRFDHLRVTRGSLSADGTRLAVGQRHDVVVFDLATGSRRVLSVSRPRADLAGPEHVLVHRRTPGAGRGLEPEGHIARTEDRSGDRRRVYARLRPRPGSVPVRW